MGGFLTGRTSLTTVQTADIANDAITEAKMATDAIGITELKAGTDGNIISFDASGNPVAVATGSDGQVLTSAGAGAQPAFETVSAGFTQASSQAATSGTSLVFGSIPTGTKMIVVNIFEVSSDEGNADDGLKLVLGDSGGLETSGYVSMRSQLRAGSVGIHEDTANFEIGNHLSPASKWRGSAILTLQDAAAFRWVCQWQTMDTDNVATIDVGAGSKALSAELTQIAVQTGTFDNGSVSIMYQ